MSSSSDTPPDTIMVSDSGIDNGLKDAEQATGGNSSVPKPKRLACMICRKRKLKCDGLKPSCSTCSRLNHTCAYDEVRRKSGPKRGYVKALEERLKQVETLLRTQDGVNPSADGGKGAGINGDSAPKPPNVRAAATANFNVTDPSITNFTSRDMDRWQFNAESPPPNESLENFGFNNNIAMGMSNVDNNFTWEMIGLGLEEPLPSQETIDELHQIYFEKIHPSLPMIHKFRYLAAMNLAPNQRPPVCLRYSMWTLACSVTEKFEGLKDLFYQRARKYVESDYIKGYGEHMISVAHAQTHVLLSQYEFKMMYFPRAWMSVGAGIRLCQMIGLHRLDGTGLDVKQCLPPPRDWTEREERRRTFWMAFCKDRYASIGTGWPMTIDEKDILTNLPCSEEAYEMSRPESTQSLAEAMSPSGASKLSSFSGIVLMACLFGRNLIHLHRPDADDRDHDLNGEFWKRHRAMDNILLNTSLCLPSTLKLPAGLGNPNIVFTNMCIHTSTICLHQAAIFKADKNRLPSTVSSESKVRCITAANEIASIMRMISHMDLSAMNPFISFCLYVAARVFVQYLKSRPDDSQTGDSLRFLLSAMNALKRRNPLTESFLVQLDVDLEALAARIPKLKTAFPRSADSPGPRVPNMNAHSAPAGAPCDTGDGNNPNGIMAYRGETQFTKPGEDGHVPGTTPLEMDNSANAAASSHTPNGLHSQAGWTPTDDGSTSLPTRGRGTGSTYVPVHGVFTGQLNGFGQSDVDSGSTNEMSGTSPNNAQSNQPTPNSSTTTSDHRQSNLGGNGRMSGSGGSSFEPSPVSSHPNVNGLTATQADIDPAVSNFFDPTAYGLPPGVSTGLTPDARYSMPETPGGGDFGVPPGWPGQTGMTPVAEGVLRSIMQMGPMETMDLGWDQNA